jgi:hypothetical protein
MKLTGGFLESSSRRQNQSLSGQVRMRTVSIPVSVPVPDHSVEVDPPTAIATPISPEVSTSFPASPTETAATSTLPEPAPPPVVDSRG